MKKLNKAGDTRDGTKNLIPLNQRTKEEASAISRKGGKTKSLAKKYSAQLRELKKKGNTNAQIKWFCQRLEDPEANILHIQRQLDQFLKDNPKEHNAVAAMNTQIQLHKAHFGEKRQNFNMNVNMDVEEWERRLAKKFGDDKDVD